ncbi:MULTISPECIES: YbaK/EbsC family protein [Thermus]|jgi:prolyl-tRNA editing enzyme YbaK/EbsC (Cys-tRNA(Pro) deacylase)|uniref:Prolyl-tRNA editing protein n=1 Tax=Thermus brockianus TaxID=56956 RepID=A0A1J0LSC5_THEBO|nr:YbaK/EbsC family protein [Thermus brockianus]APD08978.1 prolyl-tRNA synthetase [Thermus brockianus]BDG15592.1 prolyl-tRNA editing protein [Thermus brockianus]
MSPSARRVQEALEARGFGHLRVVELTASTRTAQEAAEAVGAKVGQIVKSLVFVGEKGAYLFLVSGQNRLDLRKAEALTGDPLRRATPEEVRALTGFAIGGVPPLGHTTPLPAFLDQDLLAHGEVWAAAGTPRALFRATPEELLALTGAKVADLKEA